MSKQIFILLLIWSNLATFVIAQETTAKPTAPFLAKLPAQTCWKMDFTPLTSAPAISATPGDAGMPPKKQYQMTHSGNMRQEITTYIDGSTTEIWVIDRILFVKAPHAGTFTSTTLVQTPYPNGLPDFMDLSWVDLDHFKGVEEKNGQKCFVYYTPHKPPVYPFNAPSEPETVWINMVTKLPVACEDASSRPTYTFDLPVSTLTPPRECKAVLDQVNAYKARIAGERMVLPP